MRTRRRRRGRRGRAHQDNVHRMEFFNPDYRVGNNNMLGEDVDTFTSGVTTEVIIKRKPRDKLVDNKHDKPLNSDESYLEQDLISDRRLKGDPLMEPEELEYEGRRRDEGVPRRPTVPVPRGGEGAGAGAGADDELEDEGDVALQRARLRGKEYRDYAYYDSKKLPMLVRRTTSE